jgi:hypothetical protein
MGDVSGDKGVSRERIVSMWRHFELDPLTLKPRFPSALYLLNEWRFLVDIWCEDVCIRGQRCVVRKNHVDATFDFETEICFRSVSPKRMKIFGWYLVWGCIRGQRCVRQKICVDVTLDPVTMTSNCIVFPFRSIIPKRLNIFGWYLVGGGQRCVARKNRVDVTFDLDSVTFDLDSVTLKPKFPSTLYLLNEWRFSVDIWCEDVSGDKGVSGKRCVSMCPLTLT